MSLAIVMTRANIGIEAPPVTVEAHLSNGMPGFSIVGLPETAVKESKDRVRSAIINAGYDFPDQRLTVNLAPADLPKGGGRFDLAIAVGILAANGDLDPDCLTGLEFLGELALSGEIRAVAGILPGIMAGQKSGRRCVVPQDNGPEAGLLSQAQVRLAGHLLEVCAYLKGEQDLAKPAAAPPPARAGREELDLLDVKGQHRARRALTIAAAGGHNLLLRGPPGTGKTMLASRLPGILPPLEDEQALEVAAIRSISGQSIDGEHWRRPPFRAPHHTSSAVALVGGGSSLKAGEISLAHHGILFLDELPEFAPRVLEVMREPLETGIIQIARARYQVRLPASFQLVAAMNPCPCGYHGDPSRDCRCPQERVRRYQERISGPLLDRIDLHVEVPRPPQAQLGDLLRGEEDPNSSSRAVRERVRGCRQLQQRRAGKPNARLLPGELLEHCRLGREEVKVLDEAISRLRLSSRAYHRILKIARTIADLELVDRAVSAEHLLEAVSYRVFGR